MIVICEQNVTVHAEKLLQQICRYQHDGYLCDTLIVTEDGQLSAHSLVLTAASPMFKAALNVTNKPQQHIVVIPGVSSSVMKTLLQYIYTGEVVAVLKDMASVMSLMAELQLVSFSQLAEYVHSCHCSPLSYDDHTCKMK